MLSAERERFVFDDHDARERGARAKVGTTLRGKWFLDELIAVGGMGAVYAATHRNGMRGAVKVLDPFLNKSLAARRHFLREGRLANRVRHPGVVRVLDDDETEDGTAYLVMELLTGSTLEDLAMRSGGKLEATAVIEYGLQVVDTLVEAHASRIVHRDIKPDNLFLTTDGRVKVLDFGIAGMVTKDGSPMRTLSSGGPIGTPAFMPPEQARGRSALVDHQSDLYSLGASLFTLITGELVHEADTIADMMVLAITRNPPSLRKAMPNAPEALVRAIDGALKLRKSERWANAEAMRCALREGYVALKHNMAAPERAARVRRKRWLASFAIVGFASVALGSDTPTRQQVATTLVAVTEGVATTRSVTAPADAVRPSPVKTARRYDPIYDRRY